MMKILGYLLFTVLVTVSCEQATVESTKGGECNSDSALLTVPWLKEKVAEFKKSSARVPCGAIEGDTEPSCYYIARGEFNGETIFETGVCCPNWNSIPSFYRCDGSRLCTTGTEMCPGISDIKGRTIIWRIPAK